MKSILLAASAFALITGVAAHAADLKEEYADLESREYLPAVTGDGAGAPRELSLPASGFVVQGFQGISQYDVAAYGRNFVPPDTMGAVGNTQYTEFVNGGFAVYNKVGGTVAAATSDVDFWVAAGQTSANGDTRVMYDKAANRWIALSFAASAANIQIAVSDTSNAAGTWKSTVFNGYAGFGFGATADYPTLALDNNAVLHRHQQLRAEDQRRGQFVSWHDAEHHSA